MAAVISTGKQRQGWQSRIQCGGIGQVRTLAFAKWDANATSNDLNTVNFTSAGTGWATSIAVGFDEGISGVSVVDLSFGGDWDAGANPYDSPPGIFPRDDFKSLTFYENVTDNVVWLFNYSRLRSVQNGADVNGKVTFAASGKSQGSFTAPTGSV